MAGFVNKINYKGTEKEISPYVEITYSNLVSLRNSSGLTPGQSYRITDYVTTTSQADTQSAGDQFDVIVVADSVNKLNEKARACLHSGDTYLLSRTLNAWQIWYCLDNDANRFMWADTSSGKGVIYRMIDEWNNDCPYDFKNIQFKRLPKFTGNIIYDMAYRSNAEPWVTLLNSNQYCYTYGFGNQLIPGDEVWMEEPSSEIDKESYYIILDDPEPDGRTDVWCEVNSENSAWCYTFCSDDGNFTDKSLNGSSNYIKNNKFEFTSTLMDNVLFGNYCYYNTFGNNCRSNTFGNNCQSNTFGNDSGSNTFGNYCESNTFGNNCYSNTFGNYFRYSTFGNGCESNTFGKYCGSNTFGNYCYSNTFGNGCESNTFGNYFQYNTFWDSNSYNTFGNNCYSNTFGNGCRSNTFGNGCNNITYQKNYTWYTIVENGNQYIDITSTQTTSVALPLQNVTIAQGVNNTTTIKTISHNTVGDVFKTTYQPQNSQVISV